MSLKQIVRTKISETCR